jgi:hypothetical protein
MRTAPTNRNPERENPKPQTSVQVPTPGDRFLEKERQNMFYVMGIDEVDYGMYHKLGRPDS